MIVVIHDEDIPYPTLVIEDRQATQLLDAEGPAHERVIDALTTGDAVLLITPDWIGRTLARTYKQVTAVHNTVQLDGDTDARLQRALATVGLDLHSSMYNAARAVSIAPLV
ncbi:TPA: hypothetical protein ACP7Q5_005007 [Escherichia coli]|jgi:hypothetical protein|uniref:hypothetical protein n=1 Tax=Listeria monocytogenes TaxID=1639 RepID=UPI00205BD729|nr:hypothetical protein [Staphylococcus aureus]ELL1201396.1 hypothetical protein [Staphylococcus aureus]DAH95892.1 MAG TPA: hypothetical protein [Caudoviricetes sp.]DAH95954.1 MAG TPA: hypothetical protein [Caudoviricetes sp.]HDW3906952.1 hypothetical protein [Escherichia coli]